MMAFSRGEGGDITTDDDNGVGLEEESGWLELIHPLKAQGKTERIHMMKLLKLAATTPYRCFLLLSPKAITASSSAKKG